MIERFNALPNVALVVDPEGKYVRHEDVQAELAAVNETWRINEERDIAWRLRHAAHELRRTPKPLADLIPLLQAAADRITTLEHDISASTENDHYYKGMDYGHAGVIAQWRKALTDPIPKPGAYGDAELEALYRQTEALRERG